MSYDDETLMAYADGELDETTRAAISAAIGHDPELARRVAEHRALRAGVAGAFAPVLDQPLPDRLLAAAKEPTPRGNVVSFPARGPRAAPRWSAREWTAMAASLVLGGLLSWQFMARGGGDIGAEAGALVARGGLARALDSQLASTQSDTAPVRIGVSFQSVDGEYCRGFVARSSSIAGLACREGDQWKIVVTSAMDAAQGDIRQAATLPTAVLQAIEARRGGDALDAVGEQAARDAGWRARP